FPFFLAVVNWLGIPVSLAIAVLHCLAITAFVVACHRFVKSFLFSGVLFALLLWHPISISVFLLRILRDTIYYAEILLCLAAAVAALFWPTGSDRRYLYAALAGAALGWLWLTREEGVWILPGLAVLVAVAALHALRAGATRPFAIVVLIALGMFT